MSFLDLTGKTFAIAGVALATLTLLFWLWSDAPAPRDGAWLGLAFGAGLFGAGSSWLYIAIEAFGGMPPWLAAIAIAMLTAYLALWPALAGYLAVRLAPAGSLRRLLIGAGFFTLALAATVATIVALILLKQVEIHMMTDRDGREDG